MFPKRSLLSTKEDAGGMMAPVINPKLRSQVMRTCICEPGPVGTGRSLRNVHIGLWFFITFLLVAP